MKSVLFMLGIALVVFIIIVISSLIISDDEEDDDSLFICGIDKEPCIKNYAFRDRDGCDGCPRNGKKGEEKW